MKMKRKERESKIVFGNVGVTEAEFLALVVPNILSPAILQPLRLLQLLLRLLLV